MKGGLQQHRSQLAIPRLDQAGVACRCPLEALRGLNPQNRDNCLPERNRSKRPISARIVQAVPAFGRIRPLFGGLHSLGHMPGQEARDAPTNRLLLHGLPAQR
jgi:hypothetical protein